jgi:hypothetical protein
MSHAEYHEIKAVFEKHGYTYSPTLLANLADLSRDRDDERTGIAVDGLTYVRAGGFVEIDGQNVPVYVRDSNPAADTVWGASTRGQLDAALDGAHELSGAPHERISELIRQRDEARSKIPHEGPGSPAARLTYILWELIKRFPKAHDAYSSAPPEPLLLAALDEVITSAKNYKFLYQQLQDGHEAGFKELYKCTGIEDTGEYRWKWVISELEEFVDDAKAFRFFFDEDVRKPDQMTLEYKRGIDRAAPIDFYRQLIKRYISESNR